jgi:hypothetical protein
MFCTKCGSEIPNDSDFCSKCGTSLIKKATYNTTISSSTGTRDQNRGNLIFPKNPPPSQWLTAWCLLFPGIPQLVIGQIGKGLMYLALGIVFALIPNLYPLATITVGAVSFIEARKAIATLRSGKPITKWENTPAKGYE